MKRAWACLAFLVLAGCVSSTDFDRLRGEVHDLQRSTGESRKDLDSLKERTAGVVKEDSFTAMKESQADLFAKVNEASSGIQELRGRLDENRYFTEKSLKEFIAERDLLRAQITGLENQIKAMKDRIALLETHAGPKEAAKENGDSAKPETVQQPQPEPQPDSRANAYDSAYQLFKDKKYKESRERFEAYVKEHPKTDLTDNAQFWIAESYFAEKDFESAILSYETLLKKYPDSDKSAGGLLKQGYAFAEIGDAKTCRIILNKLIEKYPRSKEAEAAKKKILDLDRKPAKKR